eukprot:782715-Amphidinium_carterae.1
MFDPSLIIWGLGGSVEFRGHNGMGRDGWRGCERWVCSVDCVPHRTERLGTQRHYDTTARKSHASKWSPLHL